MANGKVNRRSPRNWSVAEIKSLITLFKGGAPIAAVAKTLAIDAIDVAAMRVRIQAAQPKMLPPVKRLRANTVALNEALGLK